MSDILYISELNPKEKNGGATIEKRNLMYLSKNFDVDNVEAYTFGRSKFRKIIDLFTSKVPTLYNRKEVQNIKLKILNSDAQVLFIETTKMGYFNKIAKKKGMKIVTFVHNNEALLYKRTRGKVYVPFVKKQEKLAIKNSDYLGLDNDGFIDADFMAQGLNKMENIGENYKALMTLVNSQETIEVIVASQIETTLGIKTMGTTSYESTLNEMYEIEGRSLGLSKKEYQSLQPEYSTTKEWGAWFGISLYPDEGKQGLTTNGNWQVVINSSPRLIDLKEGSKKMTSVFAHEAYGHALFKLQGLPHSHGTKKSLTSTSPENNIRLEKQIHQRENEAEKNYNLHNK